MPTEPSPLLPLKFWPDHTTLIELVVPPVLINAPPMEVVKLSWPVVNAGACPLGVADTPNVRLLAVTLVPSARLIEHEMLPPPVLVAGQLMLIVF